MVAPVAAGGTFGPMSSEPGPLPDVGELDERSLAILDFERGWWKLPGAKERAIRERFGISATRYHQLLNGLIDRPEALAYDPMLVRRLRRLREARRRKRYARQLGVEQ
jgi:Protein of unknown function (DUF3263)